MNQASSSLATRRARAMGSAYRLFYDRPLIVESARGCHLIDPDGNEYLDLYNNVPHVGHCHPRVVQAIAEQAARLNTHTRYLNEGVVAFAERLTALFPEPLDTVMFCCSGTEANELALRIARVNTGGTGVIVTRNAYHGNSWAIAQASPEESMGEDRGDHVVTVPAPGPGVDFAGEVSGAIEQLAKTGHRPAALLLDMVFSSEGIRTPPAPGLVEAATVVREAGGVFIADEVQAGFGRLGRHLWGFQAHGVLPDLVTLGKPMGNGHPVAAMVTSPERIDRYSQNATYFNTFGGNPVSCAAANAMLDVLFEEELQERAERLGKRLRDGLAELARRHPCLGEVRGAGLFIGVDVESPRLAADLVAGLRERFALVGRTGAEGNVLKVRPPLAITDEDTAWFLERLEETLSAL
ncbi:MAG: aspartate aminotransferase family protein [Thermoanaerobaculia bacterium]|nr:aspartate aminotransferase family protein [Thermoanaerobaculia bacterium]